MFKIRINCTFRNQSSHYLLLSSCLYNKLFNKKKTIIDFKLFSKTFLLNRFKRDFCCKNTFIRLPMKNVELKITDISKVFENLIQINVLSSKGCMHVGAIHIDIISGAL